MVVVVIIAISAAMVIPLATRQMRDNRVHRHAREVASTYRNARMLAMARGGVVVVSFNAGTVEVREGLGSLATGAACQNLPATNCNPTAAQAWTLSNPINQVNSLTGHPGITIALESGSNREDICYTPLGRAMRRGNPANRFNPMTTPSRLEVYRGTAGSPIGLVRNVAVLPSGAARLTIAELK
jgi:type II secretory pathway pseudopilin PulG